jgi:hypothetical protein
VPFDTGKKRKLARLPHFWDGKDAIYCLWDRFPKPAYAFWKWSRRLEPRPIRQVHIQKDDV